MTLDEYKTLAETVQTLVTSVGLIAAGIWTLYNFGLTRFSAPQVEIELDLKSVTQVREKRIAVVVLKIKNTGRTKVAKSHAVLEVRLLQVQNNWPSLTRINTPVDYKGEVHEVLTTHSLLEPSEQYHEEIGFVVSGYDFLQVGMAFIGTKRYQTWEANYVFDVLSNTGESNESVLAQDAQKEGGPTTQ